MKVLNGKRLWILLDEWSVIPLELQPYLANLIRRSLFPVQGITIKIGAIEKRSKFQQALEAGDYRGIELGGDASADWDVDNFMVFDNDEARAVAFFQNVIYRHYRSIADQANDPALPNSASALIRSVIYAGKCFSRACPRGGRYPS